MAISFQTKDIDFKPGNVLRLKRWITRVIALEKKKVGELNFVFVNDAELLRHNIQYLKHDTLTDILTFDYCQEKKISGDIIISVERVKENASELGIDFGMEFRRVLIHGVLHLCGYNDKTNAQKDQMTEMENKALIKYNY
jgi:probable rRNA maturation factor